MSETDPADLSSRDRFEQVYRRHVGEVFAYAAARVGRSAAEDITAEVFHAAARAATGGRPEVLTARWLMTVVRNKVIDHWRRDQRRRAKLHLLWSKHGAEAGDPADRTATRESVMAALDHLPHHHRLLLMMHYVDGISVPELAGLIDKSVSATESALARARRGFKEYFVREETTDA